MSDQEKIFLTHEADNWFKRNKTALEKKETEDDVVIKFLDEHELKPQSVLEIGCSTGYRLAHIHKTLNAAVFGVDPSPEALREGAKLFPEVNLATAAASDLRLFEDEKFDVVIVHFVLHWIDRKKLLQSVAEINRVLKERGHLIIGDFFPDQPVKIKYHHLPEDDVYTYKQNYGALFEASNLYSLISRKIFSHSGDQSAETNDYDRAALWLLKKDSFAQYNG